MAEVNASIPLAGNPVQAPDLLGQYQQAQQIGLNQQAMQQNQQALDINKMKMQEQQAEAEAFKGADFSSPEGRNATLVQLMQKAPNAGLALMKQFSEIDKNQAQAKHWVSQASKEDLETTSLKQKAVASAALPAWNAYQAALAAGKPDQVARAEADKLMPEAISSLSQSGALSQDEIATLPRVFDPNKIGGFLMSSGLTSKMIEDRLHQAQTSSAEATAAEKKDKMEHPEKYEKPRRATPQLLEDAEGNVKSVNPETGEVKDIPGAKGMHKPGTSGASKQKANIRAASVATATTNSLRLLDDIEKEYGDKATTSIMFGDQPKSIAGRAVSAVEKKFVDPKTLKLDARANAFIDEAGPAFTGGLRVNSTFREFLLHQLPQYGDPPEVAQEKWKNFRENIKGANNTFMKAYSGNPDYWSKDTEGKTVDPASDPNFFKGGTQPTDTSAAPASKPQARPNPGEERGGWVFQGGDPNVQANWKKKGQ